MKQQMTVPFAALLLLLTCSAHAEDVQQLPEITVSGTQEESTAPSVGSTSIGEADIAPKRASTSDTVQLLQDVPGVSTYGAGGIASLPVIHGMADERLNVQVNGMGLMPACPNHMNSPLSYIDPTSVDSIKVYAGVTPVSVGGDSIGGSILVNSAAPRFASPGEGYLLGGDIGVFYRSNANSFGGNVGVTAATEHVNLTYTGSSVKSQNYRTAKAFHPAGTGGTGSASLDGDEVGSSAYRAFSQNIGLALRSGNHLLQLSAGMQKVPYEGFPNQRMDQTDNETTILNLGYKGSFGWGDLDARIYNQRIDHTMNMGPDRIFGDFPGMPMRSTGKLLGTKLQGNILYSERDTIRVGFESQNFTLNDWWTPIGGQMGPNSFWNIDYGTRNKLGIFSEWEATWNREWVSLLGVRGDYVETNAGPVQGYNGSPVWAIDAANFNARDRHRTYINWDLTALLRYTPVETWSFEFGYARKTRAPSLYQLYPWSTFEMATTMNNFAGDGGGYVGNVDLKSEVAHTMSASADWHDATKEKWGVKATAYYTYIEDYISAKRCDIGFCDPNKLTATTGFVALQHVNQTAQIYGVDLSAKMLLYESAALGRFSGTGVLSYLRGRELNTGDDLFNMMPLNGKMALIHRLGIWTNTVEVQLVADKTNVSHVRNEVKTGGYGLLNLRSSVQMFSKVRLDAAVENALNRYYQHPLGGAYVGQGNTMYLDSMHWGDYVPGMGLSVNVALNVHF